MRYLHDRKAHPVLSWKSGTLLALFCCAIGSCKTAAPLEVTLGGHVEYSLSGGLRGLRQSLTIHDTGQVEARDEKRRTMARGQLDPAQLAGLRAAFMKIDSNPASATQRLDTRCADCFQYTLTATVGGKHHRVDVDSAALQGSPYGEIVQSLSLLLRETLARPAKPNE